MKKIRLSRSKDKRYRGIFEYLIIYNYNAGKPSRYDVLVLNSDDPVIIGRELPRDCLRSLIKDYEKEAAKLPCWIGLREDVKSVKRKVIIKKLRETANENYKDSK